VDQTDQWVKCWLRVDVLFFFKYYIPGLCGNFNGDSDDDFKNRNSGEIFTDPNEFGNQFQVPDTRCDWVNSFLELLLVWKVNI